MAQAASEKSFRVTAFISGRQGSQTENFTNKREAIRQAKKLIDPHPFGSAVEVKMIETRDDSVLKTTLIFQAHRAKKRDGSLYTRSDEL